MTRRSDNALRIARRGLSRLGAMAAGGLVLCGAMACAKPGGEAGKDGKGRGGAVVDVLAQPVKAADVPMEIRTFGTAAASMTVAIRAQVTGELTEVHVQKGQDVEAGKRLFTIDRKPYEIAWKQAEATLARDRALAKNAAMDAQREQSLLERKVSSEAERDKKAADAEALAAVVRGDEAAVENAKLQLDRCEIVSPITGRAGDLLVDRGNLVKANDAALMVVNQMRPIDVRFDVAQSELPAVRSALAGGSLQVQAVEGGPGAAPAVGSLSFIDNAVDRMSGTIQMRATFPNVGENGRERFWPGQYLRVTLLLGVEKGAVVVPSQAVQSGRDGSYVYVVAKDMTAALRPVTAKRTYEGVSVVEGLAVGEQVITDGHVRLTDGSKVRIQEALGRAATAPASRAARN